MTRDELFDGYKQSEVKLRGEFPDLFSQCDSLACPPGWYDLVRALSALVVAKEPEVRCAQLKPKAQSLRFYTGPVGDAVKAVIKEAEAIARVTCQNCGGHGRGVGWDILCDRCAE